MSASHALPSHATGADNPGKQSRGRGTAIIVYMLFLGSVLAVVTAPIGVLLAHLKQRGAEPWVQSHLRFQIRTFWLGVLGGALFIAVFGYLNFSMGGSEAINEVGQKIMAVGESRTVGYQEAGAAGWIVLFLRGMFCNWMVSMGVVGASISTTVSGKIMAMWMPIIVFFYLGFEHSVVNMFLFPIGLMMGAEFTLYQYIMWNEIPTVLGNLVGGLSLVGLVLYTTHVRTQPQKHLA